VKEGKGVIVTHKKSTVNLLQKWLHGAELQKVSELSDTRPAARRGKVRALKLTP
jgi:hypothetical protein